MWSRGSMCGAVLLFLSLHIIGSNDSHADSLCQPLKRLLSHADSKFRQLRGYFDPRIDRWVATYRMPGAYRCTVEDADVIAYYACKWMHEPQLDSVSEAYSALLESVTGCLNISESSQHEHGPTRQSTRLQISGSRKTVVVERNESGRGDYNVSLSIVPLGLKDFPTD